ncbi:hypothetical protein vBAmePPT11V19_00091 [Alteromonas phage vB_AmeP_PT11-V19]|nr:hypothetical protein vBAmePPT11V19_00091 [Alteromonas phage vB_AmeP_PT11-V19]
MPDTSYIDRMEKEFKETYERMQGAAAYLKKNDEKSIREVDTAFLASGVDEISMLRNQVHQMQSYLHTLGARITFAKAKEGLL